MQNGSSKEVLEKCKYFLLDSFILYSNKDNHNISNEFEFRPDPTTDCGFGSP